MTCILLSIPVEEVIGEQAKRARRYLVMFMEARDIYIYVRLFLIRMCALSVLLIKFKS